MRRNTKCFILSMCITLLTIGVITGICTVTYKGEKMTMAKAEKKSISEEQVIAVYETGDNVLSMFAPEAKAAAQFIALLCAALSELY